MKNLVIVESPAKAKTIESFLGEGFKVLSSLGHVRDLPNRQLGIDVEKGFVPDYVVSAGKEKVVKNLQSAVSHAEVVWLASDDDREGEAIAWHLMEVLNLDPKKTRRIAFHEITKSAVQRAIESPRSLDMDLVNAQQARRILDRLVGYEVSPILWRKVKTQLSAGRVQSVAVKLVVEREREIIEFIPERYYRIQGVFRVEDTSFKVKCDKRFKEQAEVEDFVTRCAQAEFFVHEVKMKAIMRYPAAPFTTSTLQQEASRKLGFNARRTMRAAQGLYERGHITYMRTDSVHLSSQAQASLRAEVEKRFGAEYAHSRQYKTKSKGAQEAHEAIRPTYPSKSMVEGSTDEQRLYGLILKRALASQMAPAQVEKTTVTIEGRPLGDPSLSFVAAGESIRFDGFLRLYLEGKDDEDENAEDTDMLPLLEKGQQVYYKRIEARERYTNHPARYTEASLVKRLEELGIGRPSTYAPTMSTIADRGYVLLDTREGTERVVWELILSEEGLVSHEVTETVGNERKKLFPSDIGMAVTDFLDKHFPQLMEYTFTARIEEELDNVAAGDVEWRALLEQFYTPFHSRVENALETADYHSSERVLGVDPASGEEVLVRIGRYGPLAQIGKKDGDKKPRYASLRHNQLIETITLEEALELFRLPRVVGEYEGYPVEAAVGRFGPYLRHNGLFYTLPKEDDVFSVELERSVEIIEEKRARDAANTLRTLGEEGDVLIMRGRWSPYVRYKGKRYRLPKDVDWENITLTEIESLVVTQQKTKKTASKNQRGAKKTAKKRTNTKKASTSSTTTRKKK